MLKRRDVPFITVIGLLPFVLAACNDAGSSTDQRTQPPLVRIEAVEISVQSERSFTGIVAARVQSTSNFYSLVLSNAGRLELRRISGGSVTTLASTPTTVTTGTSATLRLEGGGLGKLLAGLSGRVGLMCWPCRALCSWRPLSSLPSPRTRWSGPPSP